MSEISMRDKCEALARRVWARELADAIAAIPVEPDPRDAQIAALREALKESRAWTEAYQLDMTFPAEMERVQKSLDKVDLALAATEPKGDAK